LISRLRNCGNFRTDSKNGGENLSKIISRIRNRMMVEENSFQAMVLGNTGSGKSLSAITFCKTLDPKFNMSRVVFEPEEFLGLINANLPPGSAILCDEIGAWLSSRDWYSLQNKLMSIVLETYRYKRLAVFWTVPNVRMVDVNLRDLCHAIIETVVIDRKNNVCQCKFKYRQLNPLSSKSYDKFPVVRNEDGEPITLTRVNIHRPSKDLEDSYFKKKKKHLDSIYKDIEAQLKRMRYGPKKKLKAGKKKKDLIRRELKRGTKPSVIARKLKTTSSYVREVRRDMISEEL
jgi:hypothetical protein